MLAITAAIVFVIDMVLAWTSASTSTAHLLAIGLAAMACLSLHLAFRLWWPERHL